VEASVKWGSPEWVAEHIERFGVPPIAGASDDDDTEDRRSVDELRTRLSQIQERQEEIDAEFEGKALPEEQKAEFERLQEEKHETNRLIAELEQRQEWISEMSERPENREQGAAFHTPRPGAARGEDIYDLSSVRASVSSPEQAVSELRDRALRAVEQATIPHERADEARVKAHIERLVDKLDGGADSEGKFSRHLLYTGSREYRQAFGKALKQQPLTDKEQGMLYRALSLTGASGGFAVPFTLDPTIIPTSNSSVNPTRAISRIAQIVGSNTWQGVSSAGVTASRVAEGTEATDNAPTLAQPSATVTKAHVFVPFSIEVGQDWSSLESEMARLIQDAKDDEEATAFVTGSGAGVNPQGFVTGTTNTVAGPTGLGINAAALYALEAALPPRFRPNETFVAERSQYNLVRNIDTAGGAALWLYISEGLNNQVPTPGNTGALLLGRPAYEASAMNSTPNANADKIVVLGDFRYFLIVDRIGLTVEVVPHLFGATNRFPTGQRGIYAYWRNTSKVLDANAFRALTATT
jgi:HK97 family phage major capsid protein